MVTRKKPFCVFRLQRKDLRCSQTTAFCRSTTQLSPCELYQQHHWILIFFKVISRKAVRWHLRLQSLWYCVIASFEFGGQTLPLKSNSKYFKIFPSQNRIIISILWSLSLGVVIPPCMCHGTELLISVQCPVPIKKLEPYFVNPETASVIPRAFHMQEGDNVPRDQNISYGRLHYHLGNFH